MNGRDATPPRLNARLALATRSPGTRSVRDLGSARPHRQRPGGQDADVGAYARTPVRRRRAKAEATEPGAGVGGGPDGRRRGRGCVRGRCVPEFHEDGRANGDETRSTRGEADHDRRPRVLAARQRPSSGDERLHAAARSRDAVALAASVDACAPGRDAVPDGEGRRGRGLAPLRAVRAGVGRALLRLRWGKRLRRDRRSR